MKRKTAKAAESEFSLTIHPAEIGADPVSYTLEATEAERAALADRFGLVEIGALAVDLKLGWLTGRTFLRLEGRVRARAVQSCVVTLEPVASTIDERFEILYTTEPLLDEDGNVAIDEVEPLESDVLDIAEVAAEEFALMLDPYPRAPGASLEVAGNGTDEESVASKPAEPKGNRPFEVLAALRRNK